LSREEVIRIFTDPDNFSKEKIMIFGINSASDRYRFFKETVLDEKKVSDKINEISGPLELVDRVAKTQTSYGYARPAEITSEVKTIPIQDKNGVSLPDSMSLLSGKYPYIRYLYIYARTDKKLSAKTIKLLKFILSENAQKSLIPQGLYPISESEKKANLEKIKKLSGQ
jgi:phosphate transport system substrate-binding protein